MAKHKGIFQRGNTYWIRYTDTNGRQVRESTQSDKVKAAQDLLKLRQADVVKGEQPDIIKIKNHTFKELAAEYLTWCQSQRDIDNKTNMINNLVAEFGNLPLKNFTTQLLEKYQTRLLTTPRTPIKGTTTPRQPVAQATVNRRLATIKGMFTKGCDWHMVNDATSKQVHKVKMFKESASRDHFLSAEEIQALLDACSSNVISITGKTIKQKQDHLKPIIIFALNTGCRKDEILSLKWENVDMKHGFINMVQTKNGERRQIPINDTLREMLKGLTRRLDVPWVFFEVVQKQDKETGEVKEIIKRFGDVKRSFITACKKAGINDFVFHSLRHTFASHLVMNGIDLTTVSRLMGHKSLTMTLRYSHLAPNHLTSAVNVLNSSMSISVTGNLKEAFSWPFEIVS
ncbi:MAG: site-specific integrase, partial [Chlorobium sp.]|nr:site-specific integrase [Chlorobium sp.]